MERMERKPPWVREPDKWTCPECGSHRLSAPEAVVWTCTDCGCRKSWEAFARETPFDHPHIMEGYPLDEGERQAVDQVLARPQRNVWLVIQHGYGVDTYYVEAIFDNEAAAKACAAEMRSRVEGPIAVQSIWSATKSTEVA